MNGYFQKTDIQMINKHKTGHMASLIIWKNQIKTTMKHYFVSTRIALTITTKEQTRENASVDKDVEKWGWEGKMV